MTDDNDVDERMSGCGVEWEDVSLFSISSLFSFGENLVELSWKKLREKFSHFDIKNIFLKKEKSVCFKPVESSSKTVDRH